MKQSIQRFYSIEELRNATIVDSEGLVYGYVKDLERIDSDVRIVAYIKYRYNDIIPDVDKLIKILKNRGIEIGREPIEIPISIARREGIDIPVKVIDREVELIKGYISIEEIELIDIARIRREQSEETIRIVLLSTPREALYRGIQVSSSREDIDISSIMDKLVVSKSRGILGYAKEVVVAPKAVGVRVYRSYGARGFINWISFLTTIKRMGKRELFEKLAQFRDPYRYSRLELSYLNDVKNMIMQNKESRDVINLLDKYVITEEERGDYIDIPLSKVLKVGDIVIVE